MKRRTIMILALLAPLCLPALASAGPARTDVDRLSRLAERFRAQAEAARTPLYWERRARENARRGPDANIEMMGLDAWGRPFYYKLNNLDAAATIRTSELWPGGASGYGLDGGGLPTSALGEWDGGGVRATHQEFGGRVTQRDVPLVPTHPHSTHVAGTLVASGVQAQAKGMANAATLNAWDWINDQAEMSSAAASGLWVSNHSYGYIAGWEYNYLGDDNWCWFGITTVSLSEDYSFGYYSTAARDWDQIAYNAPYYTIVKSAGNDRDDAGPGAGAGHWVMDPNNGWNWIWSTDTRDPDGGLSGYDTQTDAGNSKNVLTVGSVLDIPSGWSAPGDVQASVFSNWGPTDDGRIKPDLCGNGEGLYSSIDTNDSSYGIYSGTSMAAPNVAGSVALLYEQYNNATGGPPLASTLRGLLIHTADEAGPYDGPDYMFGWGLANLRAAADLIDIDTRAVDAIREDQISNGQTRSYTFHSSGSGPLTVTLAWTDPPGSVPPFQLDPPNLVLVNDLDLRVKQGGNTWYPWVLDPSNPSAAATHGDNFRDNVEKVEVVSPAAGDVTIEITHKGSLSSAQTYSLIFTGFDGTPVVVTDFRLEATPGRVDLNWEAPEASASDLRLLAEGAGRSWTPPFHETLPGRFSATDLDPALAGGGSFRYELQQHDGEGGWVLLRSETLLLDAAPLRTELYEPWPDPLRSNANLRFSLREAGPARLSVFDVRGRRVATLSEGTRPAGPSALAWDLRDGKGRDLPAGVYFLTLETRGTRRSRKMVILR